MAADTPEERPFPFSAQNVFLTYVRCDFPLVLLRDFLIGRIHNNPVIKGLIVKENHADGHPHLHCLLKFQRRFLVQSARVFAFQGCRPHALNLGRWKAAEAYLEKCPVASIRWPDGDGDESSRPSVEELIALAPMTNRRDFARISMEAGLSASHIDGIWRTCGRTICISRVYTNTGSPAPIPLLAGYNDLTRLAEHALVVCGPDLPALCSWAVKHVAAPFLFVEDIDELASFEASDKAVVFKGANLGSTRDSISEAELKTQIKLADVQSAFSIVRRQKTISLPAHVPRIFLCRQMCFFNDPQIRRRIILINLHTGNEDVWGVSSAAVNRT